MNLKRMAGVVRRRGVVALALCSWAGFAVAAKGIPSAPKSAPKPVEPKAPIAWGIMSEPAHCVIFREYSKTRLGFWVVAITAKTHSELEVIESGTYLFEPKTWVETQETMDELQRRAMKDLVRYVKIQDQYTPAELEAARALCLQPDARNDATTR